MAYDLRAFSLPNLGNVGSDFMKDVVSVLVDERKKFCGRKISPRDIGRTPTRSAFRSGKLTSTFLNIDCSDPCDPQLR